MPYAKPMDVHGMLNSIPPLAVYLLTGLVVMGESIGIPLPGEVILMTAALLASGSHPHANILWVALAAILGASIGDSIGYFVGHRYGERLFGWLGKRFPHHVNDETVGYAKHAFGQYGLLAVFFGRFIALLRIFAGPLAGSLKMPYPKFLLANVAGAICWGGGMAYLVHIIGAAAEKWLKDFSYIALGIAIVIAVAISIFMRRWMRERIDAYVRERQEAGLPINPEN